MPLFLQNNESKGNICNITKTTPIDISIKLENVEHIHVGRNCSTEEAESYRALFKEFCDIFAWTYKEIPGIDPSIVVHEIKHLSHSKTYPTEITSNPSSEGCDY